MNEVIGLKDIKPLYDVLDYSLYYLISLIFINILALIALVYFVVKVIQFYKNKKQNLKTLIKNISLLGSQHSKEFAYKFTDYFHKIQNEVDILKLKKWDNIIIEMDKFSKSLEIYKYKKQEQTINEADNKNFIKLKEKLLAISI